MGVWYTPAQLFALEYACVERQRLINSSIVGVLLAVLGIGLFLLLYVGLESADMANPGRLLISLCTPPLVIAAIVGAYAVTRRKP